MEIAALVISAVSLVVAIASFIISSKSQHLQDRVNEIELKLKEYGIRDLSDVIEPKYREYGRPTAPDYGSL